jgi:hypothetical protein
MQEALPSVNLRSIPEPLVDDAMNAAEGGGLSGFIFDVRTQLWAVGYPSTMHGYKYWAQVRLIDMAHANLWWQGICKIEDDTSKELPTQEQLKADNGVLLKAKVVQAADKCAEQLLEQLHPKAKMQ